MTELRGQRTGSGCAPAAQERVGQRVGDVGVVAPHVLSGRHDLVDPVEHIGAQRHIDRPELGVELLDGAGADGGRDSFAETDVSLLRFDTADAPTNAQATAHLRITVKDPDPRKAGRRFCDATMQLALGGSAGFHTTTPPSTASAYGVYWPALVPRCRVEDVVVLPDGTSRVVEHPPSGPLPVVPTVNAVGEVTDEATERVPLGRLVGARSGDKGGNANVGLWARDDATWEWLAGSFTIERFRELLPEAAGLTVRRYELPRLRSLNLVVVGLLGEGVAWTTLPDPQAKGLGEYLRSTMIEVPVRLLR